MTNNHFDPNQLRGQPTNKAQFRTEEKSSPEVHLPEAGDQLWFGYGSARLVAREGDIFTVQLERGDFRKAHRDEVVRGNAVGAIGAQLYEIPEEQLTLLGEAASEYRARISSSTEASFLVSVAAIDRDEAEGASENGFDPTRLEDVNPVRAQAEGIKLDSEDTYLDEDADDTDPVRLALAASYNAAVAVAYRHYVGDPRYPGMTQEGYDWATGPWRKVMGQVHPEDSIEDTPRA